jgi:thiol-disulfide isomerase/thioredoxin
VLIFLLAWHLFRSVSPSIDLSTGQGLAPDFELQTLDGETFRLAEHRGHVVVLNFWATWCAPCRIEMPAFVRLQDEMRDQGVLFVGVALDREGAEVVRPFAERTGVNYPIVLGDGLVTQRYGGVRAVPTTILIDRSGEMRYRHEGYITRGALARALRRLVAEPATGL